MSQYAGEIWYQQLRDFTTDKFETSIRKSFPQALTSRHNNHEKFTKYVCLSVYVKIADDFYGAFVACTNHQECQNVCDLLTSKVSAEY